MKTKSVRSRFAVPAAVALAGHAILFFGFTTPHPKAIVTSPAKTIDDSGYKFPVDDIDPPKPQENDPNNTEPSARKSSPNPVSLPDIPTEMVPPDAIAVATEPLRCGPVDPTLHQIPTDFSGPDRFGDPRGTTFVSAIDLDNTPRAKLQVRPTYPYSLRQAGVTGEVLVDFLVDEQGSVSDVRVVRSSHREFDEPTIRAVSQWKFEPGKHRGHVVRFRMAQPIGFTIGE